MMDVVMRMPDLSTVDETVTLIRWLAEVGQVDPARGPLLEVETDKAILVVESAVAGTLQAIAVPAGSEVAMGQPIATFDAVEKGAVRSGRDSGHRRVGGPITGAAGVRPGGAELAATRRPPSRSSGHRRAGIAARFSRGIAWHGDRHRRPPERRPLRRNTRANS